MLGRELDLLITVVIVILGVVLGGIMITIYFISNGNNSKLEDNSKEEQNKGPISGNLK